MPDRRYPALLRAERERWWRPLLGLAFAGSLMVVGGVAVILLSLGLAALVEPEADAFSDESLGPDTPLGLLANNLVIGLMVPVAVLAVLAVHRRDPGLLASVTGRVRWGYLGVVLGLGFVVVLAFFGLSFLLPTDTGIDVDPPPARTLAALLLVVAVTTPLQAAAEEVGFRGYLSQAVAAWFARPGIGAAAAAAVSGLLFALAHGTQDGWLFGDRLAFGLVASWLVWRTGGLEAPIALHVANNIVSLAFTASTGSLEESLTATTLEWQFAALDVTMMVVFALVAVRVAGRRQLAVVRPAEVLSPSEPVGYPGTRPPTPPPAGRENPWGMG